jgi:transposase-like protein
MKFIRRYTSIGDCCLQGYSSMMQTIFEIVALASDQLASIEFLRDKQVLKGNIRCTQCREPCSMVRDQSRTDGYFMNCYACKKKQSVRAGSFLTKSKLSIKQLLLLIYLWVMKMPVKQTSVMLGLSQNTVVDWNNMIREICSAKFVRETNPQLGGPGKIVQIDESVIYKPKYNRGHAMNEPAKWIFAMYDVEKKIGAIEFVENRSADVLLPIITKYVLPGTEIHSDQWAAYGGIASLPVYPPYTHKTVNHKRHFKDPSTGVHTNNVEAYWSSIKRRFKSLNGTSRMLTASYLDEHMYRERFGRTHIEMFDAILRDIGTFGF